MCEFFKNESTRPRYVDDAFVLSITSCEDRFTESAIMSVTDLSPVEVAEAASIAARSIAILPVKARNSALTAIHAALSEAKDLILAANARDLEAAGEAASDGKLSQSVLKRLDLGRKGKWEDMLKGILDVRDLEDPGKMPRMRSSSLHLISCQFPPWTFPKRHLCDWGKILEGAWQLHSWQSYPENSTR